MFKSKPIRMHFCCTPHPPKPHPLLPHPVASPRTDDVTDCCEHCFHGNAHHRFGLHFRQLSLHSPTTPSLPPSLSLRLRSLLSSLLTTRLMRRRDSDRSGVEWSGEERRGEGGRGDGGQGSPGGTRPLRTGRGTGHSQEDKNNAEKVPALDWCSVGRPVLCHDLGVQNSRLVWGG